MKNASGCVDISESRGRNNTLLDDLLGARNDLRTPLVDGLAALSLVDDALLVDARRQNVLRGRSKQVRNGRNVLDEMGLVGEEEEPASLLAVSTYAQKSSFY